MRWVKVTVSMIFSDILNRNFSSKLDVSKNAYNTVKNTEECFSRNISGVLQAICVWATIIQVNQDDSASV